MINICILGRKVNTMTTVIKIIIRILCKTYIKTGLNFNKGGTTNEST